MPGSQPTSAAFDRVVAEHQHAVLRICRSILRDDHLGADAAQETFLRLWARLDQGRAPQRFGAWLRRVAVSTSLDLVRRRRTRDDAAAEVERSARPEDLEERETPDARATAAELEERFDGALAKLSEGQRSVFLLRHSGGMSLSEVAGALGLALPTVKTQFARACLKLQGALAPFRNEEGRETERR